MKRTIKPTYILLLALLFTPFAGCDLTDLDINQDPNNPAEVEPNLLLTSVELDAVEFFNDFNVNLHGFTGILASADAFDLNNNSYNAVWNDFYAGPAKDLDGLIQTATETDSPRYLGVGQVLKAYFYSIMVDSFGDVPYTEALQGDREEANINPAFTSGQEIYEDLLRLCDEAIVNLDRETTIAVAGDLFYNGNVAAWKRLANTVKLRLLINSRQVRPDAAAQIQTILDGGEFIQAASQDFLFRYNRIVTPDGRHPWYQSAYASANNAFTYFLHQFMYEMLRDDDPRVPFYFKRQTSTILNPLDPTDRSTIPCSQARGCTYAYWVNSPFIWQTLYYDKGKTPTAADTTYIAGFFGRDRGDISGIPNDVLLRTAPGAYPAGGQYDRPTASLTGGVNTTGTGDGITPLITSWMVKFYQIEAALALNVGTVENARTLFETAIREQLTKVDAVGANADPANYIPMDAAAVDAYVNLYLSRFDTAPTNAGKLNVVLKQAWFSNFGNGLEIWNAFRRTGYPNTIQVPINRIRQFPLRLPYPAQELSLNQNAPQSPPAFDGDQGIFWDIIKFKF